MGLFDKIKNAVSPQKEQLPAPSPPVSSKPPMEQLSEMIIQHPDVNLKPDEVCFYRGRAQSAKKKTVTTGYKGGGGGVSFRIAKGVSVHTGKSKREAVRETVTEKYPATLYITNMRVILVAEKYGFSITFPSILQVKRYADGFVLFQTSKSYTVYTNDVNSVFHIFELINAVQQG